MIINIVHLDTSNINEEMEEVLENVARAYREKKHIVIAKRETLKKLGKHSAFGDSVQSIFTKLFHEMTQTGAMLSKARRVLKIDFSPNTIFDESQKNEQTVTIPFYLLKDSSSFQKTILLCEDRQDCYLYRKIAEVYKLTSSYRHCEIALDEKHGGGSRTSEEFEELQKHSPMKFCLCLLDNDKKHPQGKQGETANAFNQLPFTVNTHYTILECHEVENLLPFSILHRLFNDSNNTRIESIDHLHQLEKSAFEHTKYLDLKKGATFQSVMELDQKYGDFWHPLLKKSLPKTIKSTCFSEQECQCNEPCILSFAFGDKILKQALEAIDKMSIQKLIQMLPEEKLNFWKAIGSLVFWWGCAPKGDKKRA